MTVAQQSSLFDTDDVDIAPRELAVVRTHLSDGAWIDVMPGWLNGSTALFEHLSSVVPWQAQRRPMYDQIVAVPRLLCFYSEGEQLPHRSLDAARVALDRHYAAELGEQFVTAGLCLYRDGRDSVAYHGDTVGRPRDSDNDAPGRAENTMVAIVSLGAPRALLLRPRTGGRSLRYELGHGDLIVMGGSCQRTWEHAIPKTAKPVGPRISVQFRPRGVR